MSKPDVKLNNHDRLVTTAPLSDEHIVSEQLALLATLAEAVQVPFDPTRAEQKLRQAEHDIPPTATRAARQRLAQAAEGLGLYLQTRHLSVAEALHVATPENPLALFTLTPSGMARWFLLVEGASGKGRLCPLAPGDRDQWLHVDQLAQRFGADDADTVLEWHTAAPAAPLEEASAKAEAPLVLDHHDHEHHHGHHDHGHHHHHGPGPIIRLWGMLQPERRDLWIVVIYAIGIGIFSLATPLTAMAVVNSAALATLMQQLLVFCVVLFVCLGLGAILHGLQYVVVEYIRQRLFVRVVSDLAYRLPRLDIKGLDGQHGPELVNRFFAVLTVQKAGATLLLDGVAVVLQTTIGLILLAAYHEMLLGFDLILIGALVFIVFGLGKGAIASSIRESRAKYIVAGWLEELARYPLAFKLSGGARFARERADLLTREYLTCRQGLFRYILRQFAFALGLQVVASTALLGLGGMLVINGQLTLGQLVAAEIVVVLVVASFTKLGKQLESYYELLAAVDKLGHLVDLPLERTTGAAHQERSRGASLRARNLSFGYSATHRSVLENFEFDIQPGDRVALLGPNGAGKSTLVDLLFGLREPEHGYIEIDGTDLRDLNLRSIRDHIALVKGVQIFEGTVLDNVRMGREELTLADVRQALSDVGLLDEVLSLPRGLNTWLTTGGQPLSLGQAERLMLARAIVGQPRLLILDETLDNIDERLRDRVLPAILGPDAHWTLLVVTHNPDIAKLCGRQLYLGRPALTTLNKTSQIQPQGGGSHA